MLVYLAIRFSRSPYSIAKIGTPRRKHQPAKAVVVQFSLKLILATLTLCGLFFALVKLTGFQTAFSFSLMFLWLLSPVWVTFLVLYWRQNGGSRQRKNSQRRTKQQ